MGFVNQVPVDATHRATRLYGALILALALVMLISALALHHPEPPAWLYPALSVAVMWALAILVSGSLNPLRLAMGVDGYLSVSKFQFLMWNASVLFAFVWILGARGASTIADLNIPEHVLYAMGISIGTFAVAKGLMTAYVGSGRVSKPANPDPNASPTQLVAKDDGQTPDLVKIQMLVWTLVAVVVFLVQTAQSVATNSDMTPAAIPDIPATLMILMGLSQAAYVGNKLVANDIPVLTSVSPAQAGVGAAIVIAGVNLGGGVTTRFNDIAVSFNQVEPNSANYTITLPAFVGTDPVTLGSNWCISIVVDGIRSANQLAFTVGEKNA